MAGGKPIIEDILDVCKRRGIVYPSFELYGGLSGFIDYGPIGVRLKNNVENLIRRYYVVKQGCLEVSCPTLSPKDVWVASGHVDSFTDVFTECAKCGEPYRADHLLAEKTGEEVDGLNVAQISEKFDSANLTCPKCDGPLNSPYDYNLMFQTFVGPGKYKTTAYLRPETAQTTYLGFRRLWEVGRKKLPLGVLQIGRSFRNEISPRQGMIRLREFNQAEIQFFVDPEEKEHPKINEMADLKVLMEDENTKEFTSTIKNALKKKIFSNSFVAYQMGLAFKLFVEMGIAEDKLRFRQHRRDERAFYSEDTWDIEFLSDVYGKIELVGVASRTDYDLSSHAKLSKKDLTVNIDGRKFTPHVIEVAYGIDRPLYCILESCLKKEEDRAYFTFPTKIAPYATSVFPLVKKDGLSEKAREIYDMLTDSGVYALYDQSGSIGRRYARADEIGVPYCVTVDYDTMKNDTVTVRERDSKKQECVPIEKLSSKLK